MLEVTAKGHFWQEVRAYVKDVLLPYHKKKNHFKPSTIPSSKSHVERTWMEKKDILRCLEDSVLLDKARAATALNLAVPDVIAILKNTPRSEINKSGRIIGKVRKVAKIPMGVLSKDTILCLTSVESDDEVEETRVKETTFP
uniref:Uncharacterized protein n=1 Tax=Magallana gigas TaxID=29159 RepID=A0A8W8NUA9_MAGGI